MKVYANELLRRMLMETGTLIYGPEDDQTRFVEFEYRLVTR